MSLEEVREEIFVRDQYSKSSSIAKDKRDFSNRRGVGASINSGISEWVTSALNTLSSGLVGIINSVEGGCWGILLIGRWDDCWGENRRVCAIRVGEGGAGGRNNIVEDCIRHSCRIGRESSVGGASWGINQLNGSIIRQCVTPCGSSQDPSKVPIDGEEDVHFGVDLADNFLHALQLQHFLKTGFFRTKTSS